MWTVIERLSKEELGLAPNIASHRSMAVDGNRVFQWIANFNESSVRQEDFVQFLQAAESYILNFSNTSGEDTGMMEEESTEDDFETADTEDEDF